MLVLCIAEGAFFSFYHITIEIEKNDSVDLQFAVKYDQLIFFRPFQDIRLYRIASNLNSAYIVSILVRHIHYG